MRRREIVKLAVFGAGALGCGGGGDATPDAFEGTGFEMCGSNVCVDLAHATNAALRNVDGARALNIEADKLIIVRTSQTEFVVLSRICTHNGCGVGFNPTTKILQCPCHGSQFDLNGSVVRDPAIGSLTKYTSTFDEPTQILTIVLA